MILQDSAIGSKQTNNIPTHISPLHFRSPVCCTHFSLFNVLSMSSTKRFISCATFRTAFDTFLTESNNLFFTIHTRLYYMRFSWMFRCSPWTITFHLSFVKPCCHHSFSLVLLLE